MAVVGRERIIETVEREAGERWTDFRERRGSQWRNLVFYLARQRSGLTLQEIGDRTGFDYKLVAKAAQSFGRLMAEDQVMRALTEKCMIVLAKSEM